MPAANTSRGQFGMARITSAAATAGPNAGSRRSFGSPELHHARSPAPTAAAIPAIMVARTPILGISTNPASHAPATVPTVLAAYVVPIMRPRRAALAYPALPITAG